VSSLRLKGKSSLVDGKTLDSVLHMVLCLTPELSMLLVPKYETHEVNDFDEPIPHL